MPVLTLVTVTLTAGVTASRFSGDAVVHALDRDPAALGRGQLWRLLSPVLVQTDRSALVVIATFLACAVVGTLAEQVFSRRRWLALYLLGALTGHGLGEWFQPHQGGTSVAFAALLGGLGAWALSRGTALPLPIRIEVAVLIPAAVLDTVLRDIHGLPFLAGLAVTAAWPTNCCKTASSGVIVSRIRPPALPRGSGR